MAPIYTSVTDMLTLNNESCHDANFDIDISTLNPESCHDTNFDANTNVVCQHQKQIINMIPTFSHFEAVVLLWQ